jgi:hypothetical protein
VGVGAAGDGGCWWEMMMISFSNTSSSVVSSFFFQMLFELVFSFVSFFQNNRLELFLCFIGFVTTNTNIFIIRSEKISSFNSLVFVLPVHVINFSSFVQRY